MKIVSIGDVLLPTYMMEAAVPKFTRYTKTRYFTFGPDNRPDMRIYIKKMETFGFDCEPMPDEFLKEIVDADVLHMHMVPVPGKVFDVAKNLKIVASNRGGTENIDIQSATAKGIPVICNPAHNANAVAEMTVGLIIAEMRNIGRCHASMIERKKWRESFPNSESIHELCKSTAGLIGFGTIGRIVARMLKSFNMVVLVSDPFADRDEVEEAGCILVDQDYLLKNSDIVSIHSRVNPSTIGMMGEREFSLMKDTAIFVNTARPALVQTDALCKALQNKSIMGAALDVYDTEPIPPDHPLLALDNVTLTCHKGGDTVEAFADSPEMLLNQVERFFNGETPNYLVNPEVIK